MYEASLSILRHILEGDTASSTDQKNFKKLKADYVACMDQNTIKSIGLEPLADIVQNVKALFPGSTENWKVSPIRSSKTQHGISASTNDLTTAVLFEFNLGINPFISAGVDVSHFTYRFLVPTVALWCVLLAADCASLASTTSTFLCFRRPPRALY